MTLIQARTAARWLGRRSKFNARRTLGAYNRVYASASEAAFSEELALLERAGEIQNVECQPVVKLHAGITYKPDFVFTERGQRIFVDVKGAPSTDRFRLVTKLWLADGPGELRIVRCVGIIRGAGRAFEVSKVITPNASAHTDQTRKVS